ncbi:hypothetical protein F5B22DRAFT_636031 [Xylaria bambusicola]|uniref:uncharacterized protein n=1 Tax=Xylaria bambusicola TaxID=326684 RepID=UPI0020089125|nr:uncharacterized protein F5B22DRAFT_636031 [Xylaria bambusicola]KAI0517088.1 hypothetical protein F5B22DRAFT_636031 [Xylaria bambusicola]
MTLRPLRPSQSTRRVEDIDIEDDHTGQDPSVERRSGPISTPTALPRTKPATCSQCRVRKVRCDGREGLCQNCDRLGFACSFQQSPSRPPGRYLKLPERRRRLQACIPCHLKKTRCLGEIPSCLNCTRKGRECVYPTARKHASASTPDRGPEFPLREKEILETPTVVREDSSTRRLGVSGDGETRAEPSLPDAAMVTKYLEDYFTYLYPLPSFAFLHKPTVTRRCRDGTVNEALKLAICAVTSLHLEPTARCHTIWAKKAEQLILQHIGRPSIFHLQALLLVVRCRIEGGEFPTAFMLAALAARTAVALRLNYERAELAFVAQEARRRLFWALYILDDYFCVGLREFELLPEETIYLQLSCREEIFEAGQQCPTGMLRPSVSDNVVAMGLRGAYLRLISTRRAIMRFNRRVGLGEESLSTISDRIQQFEQDLARLQAALIPEHQYSVSNLASCAWPAQFVMLHISFYQCHCDIYRMFLNGYSEAAPSGLLASIRPQDCATMQAQCLEQAENIIRILGDFITSYPRGSSSQLLFLERDAAVCAFESARLVMFGSRLPCATSTLEASIHKARQVSLYLITEFFQYSASTRSLSVALENLISSYSKRLSEQAQPQIRAQDTHTEPEPEPAAPRRPSSKISRQASSRQRLSVQSLLLQSDFADDSHEIAGSFPVSHALGTTNPNPRTTYPLLLQTRTAPSLGITGRGDTGTDAGTFSPLPTLSAAGVRNITTPGTLTPPSCNNYNQQSQPLPHRQQLPLSRPASSSLWDVAIDAHREDAGLIFNPWMGFTGTEEFYGLSQGLSEEY